MHGLAALVVEEEFLIAADIEQTLLGAGIARVATVRHVGEVDVDLIEPAAIGLAVIEAKMGAPHVVAFAELLRSKGVAVVVTSADSAVASLFTGSVPLEKPFDSAALLEACERATRNASPFAEPA